MKIILLQDIPKLGKKWEVKEVSAGFARNHLFPKNLAQAATPVAVASLEKRQQKEAAEAEQELHQTQEIASRLDGLELEIPIKLNSKGESYRSISSQAIVDAIKALGFKIEKKDVVIPEPIKKAGEYPVTISLKYGLEAQINVVVIDEDQNKEKGLPGETDE